VIDEQNYYKFSALRNVHTYKAAKIMIPDLLNYPRFGFDNVGIFHNASIHNVALKENYKQIEKLILGVLNSKLFWFFIEKSSTKLGGSAIRLMPIYIDCFSFPKITKANQNIANQIIALVDEILKLKAKDSTFDTAALESQIDCLVYKLYHLTQAEIQIIESK
uniref:TaqI-like C-terminal specificity domain-containing protein n=1 Tax=Helicobacter japonicus TaxID=425400 RepID=UPI0023F4D7E6